MVFTEEEKISFFDKITSEYFNRNFGSMSKADFETLIFSEYIEHCLRNKEPFDDYTVSKQLGITQQRVRSLKERKELKYPHEDFMWENAFAEAVNNAKYDNQDHYIKMIIEDVNVMNEVRHYIEQKGWYDECSLNKKLLRIPLECFVDICLKNVDDDMVFNPETKVRIEKMAYADNGIMEFFKDFSRDGLKAFLGSSAKHLVTSVIKELPVTGFGGMALKSLAAIIENC